MMIPCCLKLVLFSVPPQTSFYLILFPHLFLYGWIGPCCTDIRCNCPNVSIRAPLPRSSSRASLQRSDENSYIHSRRFAPLDMSMIRHPISLLCVLLHPLSQISPGLPNRFSKPIVYAYSSAFRGNPCISMLYILRGRLCTARFAIRYLSV